MTERNVAEGTLTFQVFTRQDFAFANNAVLIASKQHATLISTCLVLSDAARLIHATSSFTGFSFPVRTSFV